MSAQNFQENDDFVTVAIYDQTYHLRGENPAYIERLATLVDARMRAVAAHGATVDSLRVAVLAALNIADELTCASSRLDARVDADESRRNREHSLAGLLDEVLEHDPAGERRRAG